MRRFFCTILTIATLLVFSSCLVFAETTLVLINNNAADLRPFYDEMIPLFEQSHPGVKIMLSTTGSGPLVEKIRTLIAGGGQLDIIEIWAEAASDFYADGLFLDLNSYVNAEAGFRDKLVKARLDAFTWEGKLYGLPINANAFPAYYNADMLSNAGLVLPPQLGAAWNWSTLLDYAKRLSKDTNGDGVNDIWGVRSNPAITHSLTWLHNAGGSWFDRNSNPTKSALTQPASMAGLKYYTELFSLHKVAQLSASFINSKVAFTFDEGPFFASELKAADFKWGLWKRPMGPANDGAILMGTGYSIAKNSKYPELAWEWIKFVGTRTENVKRMYEITARTPAIIPALSAYTQFMRRQYGDESAPIMEVTANPRNFSGAFSPKLAEITPLVTATLRELFKGEKPLESASSELERQVNVILQK